MVGDTTASTHKHGFSVTGKADMQHYTRHICNKLKFGAMHLTPPTTVWSIVGHGRLSPDSY